MSESKQSEIQSLKTKYILSVLAVGCVLLLCAFALVLAQPNEVCAASIEAATPTQITEDNYGDYGFTSDTYEDYLGYYAITSAEELYGFAELVNGGSTSIDGVLINDITVNENVLDEDGDLSSDSDSYVSWTPIGNSDYRYAGTFDGQGYEISGLYFSDTSTEYVGLFGYVSGSTIENVGVVDSYIYAYDYVGGVVGRNYSGSTITNCYNTGAVTASGYVGGVCGYSSNNSTITNCYNTGTVTSSDSCCGGVCGRSYTKAAITNCYNTGSVNNSSYYTGGICGENNNSSTITNCYNTGTVTGSGYVGGITGYSRASSTITNCYNTGTVTGSSTYVAGICGYPYNASAITYCYNTGTVTSSSNYVGGICGYTKSSSTYRLTISYCHNVGVVSGSSDVGSICGYCASSTFVTISACYYLAGSASDSYATSKTEEEFASGEVCYLLNDSTSDGDLVWYQSVDNLNTHGAYPVFENNTDTEGTDDTVYNIERSYYTLSGTELETITTYYSNYNVSYTANSPDTAKTNTASSITVSASAPNDSYGTVYYGIALDDGDIAWYEDGGFIDLYSNTSYTVYTVYSGLGLYNHSSYTETATQVTTDPATYIITIPMTVAIEDDSTSATLTATDLDFGYDDTLTVSISTSDESDDSTVSQDNTGYYVLLTKSDDETTTVKSYIMSGTDYLSSLVLATYTYDGLDDYDTSEAVSIAFAKPDASTLSTDAAALPAGTYSGTVVFTVEYTWGNPTAS